MIHNEGMLTAEFLAGFKRDTEAHWNVPLRDPRVWGFQFVPGTRWLPGLSDDQIRAYERDLGVAFPADFRLFLRHLNGTDPRLKHSQTGQSSVGVYSYPRDLKLVRQYMEEWSHDWPGVCETYQLDPDDRCVPIFAHRGVLCRKEGGTSPVFSLWGDDVILYEEDLRSYLVKEFLENRRAP